MAAGKRQPVIVDGQPFAAGVFLVDKPAGISSFAVVRLVRRLLGMKKVGHAGTLDPFATGLLVVCAGRPATRMIDRFMAGHKVYEACLQLGVETDTQDPEGEVVRRRPVPLLSLDRIEDCLAGFVGTRMQAPPPYSAAKFRGKPLYHYARQGILITKEPREIQVFSLHCRDYDQKRQQLHVRVVCSRGTYVRVLAAEIGEELGCGAHLIGLRRTVSGCFSVENAVPVDLLQEKDGLARLLAGMITVAEARAFLSGEPSPELADG